MKLTLTPNPDCKRCSGLGLYTITKISDTYGRWEVELHPCACVKTVITGKVPKKLLVASPENEH